MAHHVFLLDPQGASSGRVQALFSHKGAEHSSFRRPPLFSSKLYLRARIPWGIPFMPEEFFYTRKSSHRVAWSWVNPAMSAPLVAAQPEARERSCTLKCVTVPVITRMRTACDCFSCMLILAGLWGLLWQAAWAAAPPSLSASPSPPDAAGGGQHRLEPHSSKQFWATAPLATPLRAWLLTQNCLFSAQLLTTGRRAHCAHYLASPASMCAAGWGWLLIWQDSHKIRGLSVAALPGVEELLLVQKESPKQFQLPLGWLLGAVRGRVGERHWAGGLW